MIAVLYGLGLLFMAIIFVILIGMAWSCESPLRWGLRVKPNAFAWLCFAEIILWLAISWQWHTERLSVLFYNLSILYPRGLLPVYLIHYILGKSVNLGDSYHAYLLPPIMAIVTDYLLLIIISSLSPNRNRNY